MAPTTNAVTNALDLLDLLGRSGEGLRLKDIAAQLELPESSTHRLLASLLSRGFVEQQEDHGVYRLGWKIVVLANALGRDARLVQLMRPYLERLAQELKQTINLAVLSNDQVMYLDCQTPRHSLALYVAPGLTLPAHATSLGKAMLAFHPPSEQAALLDRLRLEPITASTLTSKDSLLTALADIRRRGFAYDRGELRQDVSCVAAPILDHRGHVLAAISVTAPTTSLPADWEASFPAAVTAVAREASGKLFGATSDTASLTD